MGLSKTIIDFYELFNRFRLPLFREDRNISIFLAEHFDLYIKEIYNIVTTNKETPSTNNSFLVEIDKQQEKIKELCDAIIQTINTYLNGDTFSASNQLFSILTKFEDDFSCFDISEYNYHPNHEGLFRIRNLELNEQFLSRKGLFHVPFEDNHKVKAYRYSIAGFPCLYLGSDEYICWLENQMPARFAYTKFIYSSTTPFTLLDFRKKPFNQMRDYKTTLYNRDLSPDELQNIIKLVLTYPLLAACSIVVEHKNFSFKVEYIIPQILMAWIRLSNKYQGVSYFSCSGYPDSNKLSSQNVVIAPKTSEKSGYCKELSKVFKVSNPISVDFRKNYQNDTYFPDLNRIKDLRNKIYKEYSQTKYTLSEFSEILNLFDCLLILREQLCSNNISNYYETNQLLFIIINNLNNYKNPTDIIDQIKMNNLISDPDEWIRIRSMIMKIFNEISEITESIQKPSSLFWIIAKDLFLPEDFLFLSEDNVENFYQTQI